VALTGIATLALGIGAATAMFTIVNSVLLRALPFHDADRVGSVWTRYEPESGYDFPQFPLSGPELLDYREQARALEDVAAYNRGGAIFMEELLGWLVRPPASSAIPTLPPCSLLIAGSGAIRRITETLRAE
jgi:hypothetical protein